MPQEPGQPGEISNLQLKISYWYVKNKLLLKNYLAGVLIAVSVISFGYFFWQLAVIFIINWNTDQQNINNLPNDLIDYSYFHVTQHPAAPLISSFEAVAGQGKYDFIAVIKNPNADFAGMNIDYQLVSGDQVVAERSGFIMPGEEKYFAFFGIEANKVANPVLKVAEIQWSRVHNYANFADPRLRFEITDKVFTPAEESGIKGSLPVSLLDFKIKNNSGYGYWQVGIYMVLKSGGKIVGANFLTLEQFKSQEIRNVEMRWYEALPQISEIEVVPEVNILNSSSFMPVD
jgi:hypothetical protein